LIGADEGKSPRAISELITAERLTVWYSTPTTLRSLVEHAPLASCDHSSLRIVCFAGEVFPMKHVRRLMKIWSQAQFYNLYGPTETNVCAFHRVADPSGLTDDAAVPIGRQCSGDRLRIASPSGSPVARGTDGELLVSGGSVMKGYWNAAHYDADAFLMLDGRRWYRTGDIVVEREDGELIFRGRRDRMVKRRGYRIELGEIEATLSRHEHVSQVAAVTRTDWAYDVRIVAFCTIVAEEPPTFIELKRYCVSVLPSYMVPDLIQPVSALPHTSTGKVDYRRLEELADELLAKRQSA
jgi:acyl-coenzyme A synthetase/AMP-(fatty) acid ligase